MRKIDHFYINGNASLGCGSRAVVSLDYNTVEIDLNHRVAANALTDQIPLPVNARLLKFLPI
ncbi:MAG TPA: hypothetical protein VFV87_10140 [Pirellulaceae bacterium]|nr:hypothetical protein [Pirellulaceae bacterium]